MAGVKRSREAMETSVQDDTPQGDASPVVSMFEHFKTELDQHYDRRERVIKASRDITAYSKKVIFALQRTREIGKPLGDKKALGDIAKLKQQITDSFQSVAEDLTGINAYRYQRQISGGAQEWMEAQLFEYYLVNQAIMPYEEAQRTMPGGVLLTYEDYVLGLFDMTGELMKFSITYMATNRRLPGKEGLASALTDMQVMRAQMEIVDAGHGPFGRDFEQKLRVTRQSVEKVENGVYTMTVKGQERPAGWKPDLDGAGRQPEEIESY